MALDKADKASRNPYPSVPLALAIVIRQILFTSVWEVREKAHQVGPVPNVLTVDLAGAEAVLAALEMLTVAQLAAIEECHRMNVRRLRQRLVSDWRWRSLITTIIGGFSLLLAAVKEVAGAKYSDLLPLFYGITLTGMDILSITTRWVTFMLVLGVIIVITDRIVSIPRLLRLQAFEDILNIAKDYRKGLGETSKPSAERSLTVTG
jgi:hypothetical protein